MIYVGIDVAKDKHDCFITNSENEIVFKPFTISNNLGTYLAKKRAEGKHYNVALSHATKKLVRLIVAMEKSGQSYVKPA